MLEIGISERFSEPTFERLLRGIGEIILMWTSYTWGLLEALIQQYNNYVEIGFLRLQDSREVLETCIQETASEAYVQECVEPVLGNADPEIPLEVLGGIRLKALDLEVRRAYKNMINRVIPRVIYPGAVK